jgi:hypothetical protein
MAAGLASAQAIPPEPGAGIGGANVLVGDEVVYDNEIMVSTEGDDGIVAVCVAVKECEDKGLCYLYEGTQVDAPPKGVLETYFEGSGLDYPPDISRIQANNIKFWVFDNPGLTYSSWDFYVNTHGHKVELIQGAQETMALYALLGYPVPAAPYWDKGAWVYDEYHMSGKMALQLAFIAMKMKGLYDPIQMTPEQIMEWLAASEHSLNYIGAGYDLFLQFIRTGMVSSPNASEPQFNTSEGMWMSVSGNGTISEAGPDYPDSLGCRLQVSINGYARWIKLAPPAYRPGMIDLFPDDVKKSLVRLIC